MPRTLPWMKNTNAQSRSSKAVKVSSVTPKRKRQQQPVSDSEDEASGSVVKINKGKQVASSSPPPSPPSEELMREGLDKDDRYRMVEDEFLVVAQKFTAHLHVAEYKRQQKLSQSRNAQTIDSILRPSVGRMPDETKKRLEGFERAAKQKKLLDEPRSKKASLSDDSDDGRDLPYAGTMLHGLMDSPRKRHTDLGKFMSVNKGTRSAAGYKNPAPVSQASMDESPLPKRTKWSIDDVTSSSQDEHDLDVPIPMTKLFKKSSSPTISRRPLHKGTDTKGVGSEPLAHTSHKHQSKISPIAAVDDDISASTDNLPILNDSPPKLGSGPSRMSRFERARQLQAKAEEEKNKKRKSTRDIIPTFAAP